jgi:hypothetical protein
MTFSNVFRTSRAIALFICLALNSDGAFAHTLSESHSSWHITGNQVRVEMLVPEFEAKRLSASGVDLPSREQFSRYLAEHLAVLSNHRRCQRTEGPTALAAVPGFLRDELRFTCPDSANISIRSSVLYEAAPSHTNFARIQVGSGDLFEELLTDDRREVEVTGGESHSTLQGASLLKFVEMGIMHIFTGIDHMAFMLGLVLISRRVRDLLLVVTGFTLGHSLTLALAVTGWLRPDAQFIDALVALTIVLIGAEIVGHSSSRPLPVAAGLSGLLLAMAIAKHVGLAINLPTALLIGGGLFSAGYLMFAGQLRDASRVRLLITLVFGLIHGFGFAANLLEMRLPPERLTELLIGFNVGVEIGQLAVVLGALVVAGLLTRVRLSMPRPLFTDIAAALLIGQGMYWFLGRTVALG